MIKPSGSDFLVYRAVEAIEAIEVAEAAKVNEDASVFNDTPVQYLKNFRLKPHNLLIVIAQKCWFPFS